MGFDESRNSGDDDSEDEEEEESAPKKRKGKATAPTHPFDGLITPREKILKFQQVMVATKKARDHYRVGKTQTVGDQVYTLELAGQQPVLGKYLWEHACELKEQGIDLRIGGNGERYRERRAEGSDPMVPNNFTSFLESQQDWTEVRNNGRPVVLYTYQCTDERVQYKPSSRRFGYDEVLKLDDGTILLSVDAFPIRDLSDLPFLISTKMPGYQIEAIARLNEHVGQPDFQDRMAPALKLYRGEWVDGRIVKPSFNQTRIRCRNKMRMTAWPGSKGGEKTVYDLAIEDEMDAAGIADNTTIGLNDLTRAQIKLFDIASHGTKWSRAGKNQLPAQQRLQKLNGNLELLKKAGHHADSNVCQAQETKIKQLQDEIDPEEVAKKGLKSKSQPSKKTVAALLHNPKVRPPMPGKDIISSPSTLLSLPSALIKKRKSRSKASVTATGVATAIPSTVLDGGYRADTANGDPFATERNASSQNATVGIFPFKSTKRKLDSDDGDDNARTAKSRKTSDFDPFDDVLAEYHVEMFPLFGVGNIDRLPLDVEFPADMNDHALEANAVFDDPGSRHGEAADTTVGPSVPAPQSSITNPTTKSGKRKRSHETAEGLVEQYRKKNSIEPSVPPSQSLVGTTQSKPSNRKQSEENDDNDDGALSQSPKRTKIEARPISQSRKILRRKSA